MSSNVFFFQPFFLTVFLLSATSVFDVRKAEPVWKDYKKDELRYFEEVAFRNNRLARWQTPVLLSGLERSSDTALRASLHIIIEEIKPLLGNIPVRYTSGKGNIIIHSPGNIDDYKKNYTEAGNLPLGYAKPAFSKNNSIIHVDVYLHPHLLPGKKIQILQHELCHALGLLNHPTTPFTEYNLMGSAIYGQMKRISKPKSYPFSRLDKAALRLLYDNEVKNLTKQEFEKLTSL